MAGQLLFQTAIGQCGIAWGGHGIVRTALPGQDGGETCRVLNWTDGNAAQELPSAIKMAVQQITGLLEGSSNDLRSIALDWRGVPEFEARVYAATRMIGPGQTATYGEVAALLGDKALARAVGQALGRNPWPIVVPCHRVLAAGGKSGGFSAPGGISTKRRMLAIESVHGRREGDLFGP